MFEDETLKIRLYIWTALFMLGGAAFGYFGWEILGILLWVVGGIISLHVVIVSVVREYRKNIEAQAEKIDKQLEFYKHVQAMTDEEKHLFGMSYVPQEVTVKKDKTSEVNNEFSQTWKKLPVAPYKLKVIAQACLNGEGFTIRKWAGEGKLLTDPEWRALHDAMVELGMLEPRGDDPREGFMWTSFGEDVMSQVVKDTL